MLINLHTYRSAVSFFSSYEVTFADTPSGERWEAYTRNGTEIYVRRRQTSGVWDPEILVCIGVHLDILYLNGYVNLVFEHNGKIYWRAWPEDSNPAFIKPPGLLTESVYFSNADLCSYSIESTDPIEPKLYDTTQLLPHDLGVWELGLQPAPGIVVREDANAMYWAAPGTVLGASIAGYHLYRIETTGVISRVNSELLPGPLYSGEILPGTYYATACVSPGLSGEFHQEGLPGSSVTVRPTEAWKQEDLSVVRSDLFTLSLVSNEFYSVVKTDGVQIVPHDLMTYTITSTVLDYTPI